jgi:hypothetical protein
MGNECMYYFISSRAFFDVHECVENCACNSKNNSFLLVMMAKQEPKLSLISPLPTICKFLYLCIKYAIIF